MIQFQFARVNTTKAAVDAVKGDPSATFIAGGTNLVDLMKRGITTPQKIIDINALPLRNIEEKTGTVYIGALALNSIVAADKTILQRHPLLAQALHAGASAQLRNMATVGGNLMQRTRCPYFYDTALPCNKRAPGSGCGALEGYNRMHAIFGHSEQCIAVNPSDMNVALAALDATVVVTGPRGERRIPFADFHRLPGNTPQRDTNLEKGELILSVEIPANPYNKNVHYLKLRDRASYAFALVSVAAALDFEGQTIRSARLAMGGVAHKPWRQNAAEQFLAGKMATAETFQAAAKIAMKDAKPFPYNKFKLKMGHNAIIEALKRAAAGV